MISVHVIPRTVNGLEINLAFGRIVSPLLDMAGKQAGEVRKPCWSLRLSWGQIALWRRYDRLVFEWLNPLVWSKRNGHYYHVLGRLVDRAIP